MDDDPLFQRAERAIRECVITRKQARENLERAHLAAARVRATLRMIRARPNYRFHLEMVDTATSALENPLANRSAGYEDEKPSE